jgi:MFS family permease
LSPSEKLSLVGRYLVFAVAFALGAVLMSFEMLASRYLTPYFGGGIETWAALISTVLLALMAGYLAGGHLADRSGSPRILSLIVFAAGALLVTMPLYVDALVVAIGDGVGDGVAGVLVAAFALLFVPLSLLGAFSPYAVKLLIESTDHSGRVTGWVYGISTIGNVVGTLGTTLVLIPTMGIRSATYLAASVTIACALALLSLRVPK